MSTLPICWPISRPAHTDVMQTKKGIIMNRRVISYLVILFSYIIISGCAQPSIQRHVDGLAAEKISIIKTENKKISIIEIDGQKSVGFMEFMLNDWAGEASLRPGRHEFNIMYDNGHIKSQYIYNLITQAGRTYIIKHKIVNSSIALWFEDLATRKQAGNVIMSMNEPITDKSAILNHSAFFTMKPPQEDDWVIAYRDNSQISLAKYGNDKDETYAIMVTMVQIPNLDTENEFMNFIKESRDKDTDPKRFKVLKDEINIYKLRADFCVSYHTIAEDNKAVKRLWNNKPMLLEIVGYSCRYPLNKKIVINFNYSHRYYPGNEDKELLEKANKVFSQLEF